MGADDTWQPCLEAEYGIEGGAWLSLTPQRKLWDGALEGYRKRGK